MNYNIQKLIVSIYFLLLLELLDVMILNGYGLNTFSIATYHSDVTVTALLLKKNNNKVPKFQMNPIHTTLTFSLCRGD